MMPNGALDSRIYLCQYVPGFQRQDIKHVITLSDEKRANVASLMRNSLINYKIQSLAS